MKDIAIKITNCRFRRRTNKYIHIAIDKNGYKYTVKSNTCFNIGDYYCLNMKKFETRVEEESKLWVIPTEFEINKLEIYNGRLSLNSRPFISNELIMSKNQIKELKMKERISRLRELMIGCDSAAQYIKYQKEYDVLCSGKEYYINLYNK